MINQPENNIKLNDLDLVAIETAKVRLSGLEAEIGIANKTLGVINKDISKAVKEREYQEDLLITTSNQVTEKEKVFEGIEASIVQGEESLSMLRKEEVEIRKRITKDEEGIKERNDVLIQKEANFDLRFKELKEKEVTLYESEIAHKSKVDKLKEVLKEV